MISIKQIKNEKGICVCMNCNRHTPLIMRLTVNNLELDLCEDCSNAIGTLHVKSIESGNDYLYIKDDFKVINK